MKALGPLAVAERDILAWTTAQHRTRENRARSGDSVRSAHRQRPSPFQSARGIFVEVSFRTIQVKTACATYFVPGGLEGRGGLAGRRP